MNAGGRICRSSGAAEPPSWVGLTYIVCTVSGLVYSWIFKKKSSFLSCMWPSAEGSHSRRARLWSYNLPACVWRPWIITGIIRWHFFGHFVCRSSENIKDQNHIFFYERLELRLAEFEVSSPSWAPTRYDREPPQLFPTWMMKARMMQTRWSKSSQNPQRLYHSLACSA